MARTTATTREQPPGLKELTGQQTLDRLMELEGIHGKFDGPRAMRIMAIARQHGIKAEALKKGLVRVRPSGKGYTLEVDQ